jgi:DNA-binding transcriptional LysR family regulator
MLPDVDSLALFLKACEFKSLTKAAEASNLSLAAASRRIALLEHRFKATLFERTSRGIDLTPAGEALVEYAKRLLVQINQMQSEMTAFESGNKGLLRIMASTSVIAQFLPNDIAKFSRKHPAFKVIVQERWSVETVAALLAAEADVGVIMKGPSTEGLEVRDYKTDHLSVLIPKDHPLAKKKHLRFSDVLDYDIVGLEANANLMKLFSLQASNLEKTMRLRAEVRSFEAILPMVQAGIGVGFVPYEVGKPMTLNKLLVCIPIEEEWAIRQMQICYNKKENKNPALVKFLESLETPDE